MLVCSYISKYNKRMKNPIDTEPRTMEEMMDDSSDDDFARELEDND